MAKQDFKYIKGEYSKGAPADIYFYTDVDWWSVDDFLCEFNYLVNIVVPSVIRIHINSVGGSVVDGMSVFSRIMDCKIPTQCYNDALAASMGSVIWAAGDEVFMRDYALLMIHNPFIDSPKESDKQAIEAFTSQLRTIYSKRFGMTEDEVEAIMNGEGDNDGTFFTAEQAVEKGFIKAENVIETPSAVKNKVMAALRDVNDLTKIKAVYGLVSAFENKPTNNNNKTNSTKMDERISVFAALLGLSGEKATAENVTASINDLKAQASKVSDLQKSLDDAKTELTRVTAELTGSQTSVKNLTEDLKNTKAALKVYQDAETQAKADKVKALIDKAVQDCKISKEEADAYTKMATDNYELAENVLAKIPARDDLGNLIAAANVNEAKNGIKTAEQQVDEAVQKIVGSNFKFRTL